MNDSQIKTLITKLRSNTLSHEELLDLNKLLNSYSRSKKLTRILQEDFEQIKDMLDEYPDYGNKFHTEQRIIESIQYSSQSQTKSGYRFVGFASIAIILLSAAYYLASLNYNSTKQDSIEWINVKTSPGMRKKVVLPDSTEIILNGKSKLQYPKIQNSKYRLVKIDGEGFFKISRNEKRPFYVLAPKFTTKVLGTSFNINTDIKSNIEVRSGVVKSYLVSSQYSEKEISDHFSQSLITTSSITENNMVELKAGDAAVLTSNNEWIKQKHNNNFWFNNELVYFAEPLKNVIKSAYRNFGDSISIDKKLEDVSITITFRGKNKEQVIYTLADLARANVKINYDTKI